MSQEFQISDDMLNFAHKLDCQNFNVKSYRKRNAPQPAKRHKKGNDQVELIGFSLADVRIEKSAQKTHRTTALSTRRFSSTAGVKKRSQLENTPVSIFNTARTKFRSTVMDNPSECDERQNAAVKWGDQTKEVKGKFSQKERDLCKKGPLQNKHFEQWLNHALLESCRDEKFDRTIENPALKKYGIDKNSLLSKGINPQSLNRIFRALFVYSIGFNELLKEVGGQAIRKALWKVFTILLEYCSDGDFETMIGEIQRDKVAKLEMLREEIERRQEIIDNNQEIHQKKNAKIFKQLKQLRQQNTNLEHDKQVLMEDYKEAEQAFNQQVSLRLKFQNKINEIHGVHHELTIKHTKLYDDLQFTQYQNKKLKNKQTELTENLIRIKNALDEQKNVNAKLNEELKYCAEQTSNFKEKNTLAELKEIQWNRKVDALNAVIHQKGRKIQQIKRQLENAEMMINLGKQSQKQLQKQYQRSLDQNKQLVESLQNQLEQLNKYMLEKKQFNDTHARIYAELALSKDALNQKKEDIDKSRKVIKQLNLTLNEKDVIVQSIQTKNQQLHVDLADCYGKIEEMKKIKNAVEEQASQLRRKQMAYKSYFADKEKEIGEMNEKIEDLERRISEFNILKRTLDSKITLLTQKMNSDEEMFKKKIVRLEQEQAVIEKERIKLKQQNELIKADSIKYKELYQQAFTKVKDHIFERNDLELRYNQSLHVVENETDHIKKLSIRISEMEQRNEQIGRQLKSVHFVMEGKQKTFKMQLAALNRSLEHQKKLLHEKKQYVHPMVYEDAVSAAISQAESFQKYKQIMQKRILESKEHQLEKKLEKVNAQLQKSKSEFQKEIQLANRAFEDEKVRTSQLQEKLKQKHKVQQDLKATQSFKTKQKKYLEFIKDKSSQIEQLHKQVERMQDANTKMIGSTEVLQKQLEEKNKKIEQLQNEKKRIQYEKKSVEQQRKKLEKAKEQMSQILDEGQSKYINDHNRQQNSQLKKQSIDARSQAKSRLTSRDQQRAKKQERTQWRNDFTKKVKNAYNYYKK